MKIVFVCEWNLLTGGGFNVVQNLVETMPKLDSSLEFHIVSFGEKNETVHNDDFTVHYIRNSNYPLSQYWYLPKRLKEKIFEINPDLVHLHFTYPPYSFVTRLSVPVVITTHGLVSIREKGFSFSTVRNFVTMKFILNPYFEKKALQNANKIVVVSKIMNETVDHIIGYDPKTVYIPNGIDYEKFNMESITENNQLSILFIGRLIKVKGVDILIRALPIIKKTIPNIHLFIAGDGSQCKKLKHLTMKLGVAENTTFLGFISGNDKLEMFRSANIFVIPSRFESFGITALEALAAGVPIIASNVGGIPDILDNNKYGMLVESDNSEALAQCIVKLANDLELRNKMIEAGKRRAKDFSWNDVAKETIRLYYSLV